MRSFEKQGSLKAPGPDGFEVFFFKKYGQGTKRDVTRMVRHFFEFGSFSKEINHPNIILIPKIDHPTEPEHFRPIRLTNVT